MSATDRVTAHQLTLEQAAIVHEKARRSSNADLILDELKKAGARGLTNRELAEVGGFRYSARLLELKKRGVAWDKRDLGGGLFLYWLVEEAA